jgi:hypothetical protein
VALLAGACGGSKQAATQTASSSSPGSTQGPGAASASPGKSSAGSKTTASPAAAIPTPAPATGAVAATASPPQTGTYTYKVTFNGNTSTRKTTITSEGGSSSGAKQAETATAGNASATQHVVWTSGGKYLADTVSTQGSNRFDCDWKPDMIEYQFPMRTGAHWTQTTSCTVTFGATKVTSQVHNDATVRGNGQVTIGGRTVKVWVIETKITTKSSDGTHTTTAQATRTTQFSPEVGLAVRYTETGKTSTGPATATFELQNIKPQ